MKQKLAQVALVVADYDEAIEFYTQRLRFQLIEDTPLTEHKRWVVVAPPGTDGCRLLLAKAATEAQKDRIGDQTGGRVFLFLHTDDLERDYFFLRHSGIRIVREPSIESYGKVLVFADLYGNLWDLIETKHSVG